MQHRPLVSKIRCHHPNKNASKICNKNYLEYIGTREGVDLTAVNEEEMKVYSESENDAYAEYIAKRPGSHGLFGNIDITDIKRVSNYVADLTRERRNIYRGIVSLSEADALALGYDAKQPWVNYMRSVLPDVAKEFDIPVTKVEWVAAVHMEKGHPHCHYMFWNKEDQIHSAFIHTSKQTRVREKLSGIMFQDERKVQVAEKTARRDQLVSIGKDIFKNEFSSKTVMGRIRNNHLENFGKELLSLSNKLPSSGRLNYKFLPAAAKEKINEMVDIALEIPALKKEYAAYMKSSEDISRTYSPSQKHNAVTLAKADQDIRKRLANAILKSSKSILKNDYLLKKYADSIKDSNYKLHNGSDSYRLGKKYANPEGEYYNLDIAIKYFSMAAEQGNVYAKIKLGNIYLFDKDYKNVELGNKYLQEAAETGNEVAENILKNYQDSRTSGLYSLSYQCVNSLFQNLQTGRTTRETFNDLRRFRSKSKEQKKIDAKEQRGKNDMLPE